MSPAVRNVLRAGALVSSVSLFAGFVWYKGWGEKWVAGRTAEASGAGDNPILLSGGEGGSGVGNGLVPAAGQVTRMAGSKDDMLDIVPAAKVTPATEQVRSMASSKFGAVSVGPPITDPGTVTSTLVTAATNQRELMAGSKSRAVSVAPSPAPPNTPPTVSATGQAAMIGSSKSLVITQGGPVSAADQAAMMPSSKGGVILTAEEQRRVLSSSKSDVIVITPSDVLPAVPPAKPTGGEFAGGPVTADKQVQLMSSSKSGPVSSGSVPANPPRKTVQDKRAEKVKSVVTDATPLGGAVVPAGDQSGLMYSPKSGPVDLTPAAPKTAPTTATASQPTTQPTSQPTSQPAKATDNGKP